MAPKSWPVQKEEVYKILGLDWVAPEMREDRGEVQAAKDKKLPKLITVKDIRAELHSHSTLERRQGQHSTNGGSSH